jgi:hypothetical protein
MDLDERSGGVNSDGTYQIGLALREEQDQDLNLGRPK